MSDDTAVWVPVFDQWQPGLIIGYELQAEDSE